MFNSQTPFDFNIKQDLNGYLIEYSNLMEISQSGPEVGDLIINGKKVTSEYPFGGPCIIDTDSLYVPVFIRKFMSSGFKVCRLNLKTFEKEYIGKKRNLILLEGIMDGRIWFFENIEQTQKSSFAI